MQSRDLELDIWAMKHYSGKSHSLNLSYDSFIFFVPPNNFPVERSFEYCLYPFMKNIDSFLKDYPYITGFSINGMNTYWDPKTEIPQILNNPQITRIDFGKSGVKESDIEGLFDNTNLLSVNLDENGIVNIAFKENRRLQTLSVASNNLSASAISAITRFENLRYLDISNNKLTDAQGVELVTKTPNLQSINLRNTKIGKETITALLNSKLTEINVNCSDVGCINKLKLN